MGWQLRVGAVQMRSGDDLVANLGVVRELGARAARDDGAKLVVLPECFSYLGAPGDDRTKKLATAETFERPGPVMDCLREVATKHGVWVVGGGTAEPADAGRTFNTAVVVGPDGRVAAKYRKVHLFDVDIPGGAVLKESDTTAPGCELVVVEVEGAKVGLSICYDVRFPELYRALVKDRGAEVLLVPAAFTAHTGAAHWELLLRARAVEDQAYVVAAAQWGKHNAKRESFGHSCVVDPWGTVVAMQAEGDGVVSATLEGDVVAKRRTQMPALQHAVLWR